MALQLIHPDHGLMMIPRREVHLASQSMMLLRWVQHQVIIQGLDFLPRDYEAMGLYPEAQRFFDTEDPTLWELHLRVMLGINKLGVVKVPGVVAKYSHDIVSSLYCGTAAGVCIVRLVEWTRERLGSEEWVADAVDRARCGDLGIRWK